MRMKIITIAMLAILIGNSAYAQYNYGSIAYDEVMNIEDQLTIEAWVKVGEFPEESEEFWQNGDYIYIISQSHDMSAVGNYTFGFNENRLFFAFSTIDSRYSVPLSTPLEPDTWIHLAVVHTFGNGASTKTYVNGIETNSGTWYDDGGEIIDGDAMPWDGDPHTEYYVGDCIHYSSEYNSFFGQIDELRIWETARTETDIQSTMNTELNGDETNLVAYWNFNDLGNTTQTDLTTNSLALTVMNEAEVINSDCHGSANGALRLYGASGLSDLEGNSAFKVYPIPANGKLNIESDYVLFDDNHEVEILLVDCLGKKNMAEVIHASGREMQIDISNTNTGLYFLQISVDDKIIKTSKVFICK